MNGFRELYILSLLGFISYGELLSCQLRETMKHYVICFQGVPCSDTDTNNFLFVKPLRPRGYKAQVSNKIDRLQHFMYFRHLILFLRAFRSHNSRSNIFIIE